MSSKSGRFLRTLPSGVKLYLRDSATNGSWRRVPGLSDEEYFSKVVGDRCQRGSSQSKRKSRSETGTAVDRVVIEYEADGSLLSQKLLFWSGTDSTKARAMWCLTPGSCMKAARVNILARSTLLRKRKIRERSVFGLACELQLRHYGKRY
jgi:hypothetical protein